MKILAVDDEQTILYIIEEFLQWRTHTVVTAKNGREGFNKFMESPHSFDVILSDINMPCVDGIEMIKEIRQRDFVTPAIFITASGMPHNLAERNMLRPFAWIEKPFDLTRLEELAIQYATQHTNAVHRNTPATQPARTSLENAPHISLPENV